jgi:hypothetical protein
MKKNLNFRGSFSLRCPTYKRNESLPMQQHFVAAAQGARAERVSGLNDQFC